ncbi:RNA-dependent RNA polymerase [Alphachrysovirus cerasi]|uniref:RNA-directed RNA polymerase n=1 Tax=Alphachrysovirus cerasi TaxID=284687 RepID=Q65A74_9VIRU|nr:RNA-dependent RNA polymerase [Alphachrysovirus cerasi]
MTGGHKHKTPGTSQTDKKFAKKLAASMDSLKAGFATNKSVADYTMKLQSSMSRYEENRISNLFAIVMPGGTGKTRWAREYGLVDVDELVSPDEHENLYAVRKAVLMQKGDWVVHNSEWANRVRFTLMKLDYNRPVVLLCHTEEFAYEVGALPILAITMDEGVWRKNIENRGYLGKMFSELSYESVRTHTKVQMFKANSNEQVERAILRVMSLVGIPSAAPLKYDADNPTPGYSAGLPDWVMKGEKDKCHLELLMDMYDQDCVPKECMDYFCRNETIPASYGFGITMNDWARVFGTITYYMRDVKNEIPEGDPEDIWPYSSDREKTRLNVNMKRLLTSTNLMDIEGAKTLAATHVGATNGFVSTLVSFWTGIQELYKDEVDLMPLCLVGQANWVYCQKMVHDLMRQSRHYMNTEVEQQTKQSIMYMDQLVGRRLFKPDWQKEVDDRQGNHGFAQHMAYDPNTGTWEVEQYRKDFNHALNDAFARVKSTPRVLNIKDYADFFSKRGEWLTKGSTVYNEIPKEHRQTVVSIVDEIGDIVRSVDVRHNKKSLFEMSNVFHLLGDKFELRNITKAVPKLNECGYKDRTLLPGSLFHYLMFSYVLEFVEKQAQIGSVRVNAPSDNDIRYMDKKMTQGVYHMMFDWANFNAFHSAEEMSLVIEKLAYVVPAPPDYDMFVKGVAASMWDMILMDPDGDVHKIETGLYSGWRGTSFLNSVLNSCYTTCARMSYERIHKYDPFVYIDHGGDDIDGGIRNMGDGVKMLVVMEKMQFEAQKIKQMIGIDSEFFRITFTASGAYGSATRALARFVSGNWEGSGIIPLRERISGLMDQMAKICRRGFHQEVGHTLLSLAIAHWGRVKPDKDWLALPAVAIHGCEEQGGLGVPDKDGCVWWLDKEIRGKVSDRKVLPPGKLVAEETIRNLAAELNRLNIDAVHTGPVATKLAAMSFDERGEETFETLEKADAEVVKKVSVIVPKVDEHEFEKMMAYVETNRSVKKDLARLERYRMLEGHLQTNGVTITSEDLAKMLEINLPEGALQFKPSKYYRRLVGDEWAAVIEEYSLACMQYAGYDKDKAEDVFETLTYMVSVVFKHHV